MSFCDYWIVVSACQLDEHNGQHGHDAGAHGEYADQDADKYFGMKRIIKTIIMVTIGWHVGRLDRLDHLFSAVTIGITTTGTMIIVRTAKSITQHDPNHDQHWRLLSHRAGEQKSEAHEHVPETCG